VRRKSSSGSFQRLHEEGWEEAGSIHALVLPTDALHAGSIEISHEFQPVTAVGGDFLNDFELPERAIGLYLVTCRERNYQPQCVRSTERNDEKWPLVASNDIAAWCVERMLPARRCQ